MTNGKLIGKLIKLGITEHSQLGQVSSTLELHNELITFLTQQNERLWAIQCDVADCYNQLDSKAVYDYAWYLVKRFAINNNTSQKCTFKFITFDAGKSIKITPTEVMKPQTSTSKTLSLTEIGEWLTKSSQLKIQVGSKRYVTSFVPHSLTVSSSSVNGYLQDLLRKKVVNKLDAKNYKIFRFMDDMVIISTSLKTCETVYKQLKSQIKLGEDKTKRSVSGKSVS